ncbi:hypothetical protein [Sulfurimonas sp.]|nr:hypothetical protein [Sulfurimonas sp.]
MFAFFISHNYIHNPYHASHDSSCSVYVLEEFFFAGDLEIAPPVILLFIPFFQIFFIAKKYNFKRLTYANIRAPPLQ